MRAAGLTSAQQLPGWGVQASEQESHSGPPCPSSQPQGGQGPGLDGRNGLLGLWHSAHWAGWGL